MRTAVPLLWNCRLPDIVVPHTWFVADPDGMFWICRLPLIVVDGPIEKVLLPPFTVTLPPTVALLRTTLPPVSVMFPDAPPPTSTQLCPLTTVRLPWNVPV